MNESKATGREKLSGSYAIVGHAFYITIILPIFLITLSAFAYSLLHSFKLDIFCIVALFAYFFFLISKTCVTYSDVYIEGNVVVLQKLWGTKKKSAATVKSINYAAILPYTFTIEYEDGRKDYFWLKSQVLEYVFNSNPDKALIELRLKFKALKDNALESQAVNNTDI